MKAERLEVEVARPRVSFAPPYRTSTCVGPTCSTSTAEPGAQTLQEVSLLTAGAAAAGMLGVASTWIGSAPWANAVPATSAPLQTP